MNIKALLSSSLVILFVAALLFSPMAKGKGLYAHAELGRSAFSDDIDVDTDIIDLDGHATSFRFAVGYDLNRYLSVEGGYVDFGKIDFGQIDTGTITGSAEAQADGLEFSIIGRLPAGERFSLTGRTGLLWWDAETQIFDVNGTASHRNVFVGVGGEISATERLGITAGWTRYKLDDDDIDYFSLGLRFRFGAAD
jgi:OOP family OmpA-OmpF porin